MNKIGITNGVFDLFHNDHKRLIDICKSLCDYLVVYIDSDEFTTINKGRPPLLDYHTREKALLAYGANEVRKANSWDCPFEDDHFDTFFFGSDQLEYKVWEKYINKLKEQYRMYVIPTGAVHSRHLRELIDPFVEPSDPENLQKVVDVLNKHNIDFCAICGTLLGLCRNNKKIPWDKDYDLMVMIESYWQYYKLKDLFIKEGFEVDTSEGFIQLESPIRLDIFRYNYKDNFVFFKDFFPIPMEDLIPFEMSVLDGVQIPIPKNSEKLLDIHYPNWRTNFNVWKTYEVSPEDINC